MTRKRIRREERQLKSIKMSCCSNIINVALDCENTIIGESRNFYLEIKDKVARKAIKLLARQYVIDSIHRDPPHPMSNEIFMASEPFIITYYDHRKPKEKFQWAIYDHQLKK